MGFDLMLIATNANDLKIPVGAKCCICHMLLDDGVGLSGCSHNACYKCMKNTSKLDGMCPLDGKPFDMRRYFHLSQEIEDFLSHIKLKCGWFDGQTCTATAIAFRNAHHHRQICPNNPKNKQTREQMNVVKFVRNWLRSNDGMRDGNHSESNSGDAFQQISGQFSSGWNRYNSGRLKPRSGYGFRPNKRTVGHRFFANDMNSEFDSDWRK